MKIRYYKIISALLVFVALISLLSVHISAKTALEDRAGLLTAEEEKALSEDAKKLEDILDINIIIHTTDDTKGKSARNYADDRYDSLCGVNTDGILLLIATDIGEVHVSTSGCVVEGYGQAHLDSFLDNVVPYLSGGEFYSGCLLFLDYLDDHTYESIREAEGIGGDLGYYPEGPDNPIYTPEHPADSAEIMGILNILGVSFAIGAVISLIVCLILRSGMNTARLRSGAEDYLLRSTFTLSDSRDIFLYTTTTRVRVADSSNNGSGRSGGGGHRSSSSHRSSSGGRHGGGGRRF